MAFADPQTVTINAVAQTLARVSNGVNTGAFRKDDGLVGLSVGHTQTKGRRYRRTLRLDHAKITADPFLPAQNTQVSMSFYVVADIPPAGYTIAEQKQVIDGLIAYLSASSGAKITQLLGGEN